jgi:hypothetical protein
MNHDSVRVLPYLIGIIFLATAAVTWLLGDDPVMAVVWISVGVVFMVSTSSASTKHE